MIPHRRPQIAQTVVFIESVRNMILDNKRKLSNQTLFKNLAFASSQYFSAFITTNPDFLDIIIIHT